MTEDDGFITIHPQPKEHHMLKTRADYLEAPDSPVPVKGIEAIMSRVQTIRENLAKTGGELADLTDRVLGTVPTNASAGGTGRVEPNGQLERLDCHLDHLDAYVSDLARIVHRLREGL